VLKRLQCDGAARPSVGHVTGRKAPTIVRRSPAVTTTRLAMLTVGGLVVNLSLGCAGDDRSALEVDGACGPEADLRLVFTGAADEEGGDLFGLTRDGQVRRLTDDGGSFGSSFSPDGTRIVFSSVGDTGDVSDTIGATGLDLHVMAADGSGRRRLLDGEEDVSPAWSPDGDQIAFVRGGGVDAAGRIFILDADDDRSARALIEPDGPGADADPAWSPDGTQLAFVRTEPGGPSHLMVADADGSDVRSVLERPDALGSPSWSPDGTTLAFTVGKGGESGGLIALLDVEDGSVETAAEGGLAPVWSASGRLYAYGRAPGIADFSGRWRVAELAPDGASGFGTGRAVSSLEPIGYLYGDAGIDVPRCDGPDTSPLTSAADVPETLVITDPATGEDVTVLPREQAVALLNGQLSGMPADAEPAAKLVHTDAPDAVPLHLSPGLLVWVVRFEVTPSGELGIVVFDATTGEFLSSSGVGGEEWERFADLAA
jgi:WD40-like Beta Propeller Repeat